MPWELTGNEGTDPSRNFLGTTDNAPLIIRTGNGERLRIRRTGEVGIGTTNPDQKLTLGSGNIRLPNAKAGADGNLYFGGITDAGETGLRLFGGQITDPAQGTLRAGFIDVVTTDSNDGLRFRVDGRIGDTERMRITASGNVGIGTPNPDQRLTIGSGNIRLPNAKGGADGNLYFGGITLNKENGLRLSGGNVAGQLPSGYIDVRTDNDKGGLIIRVDKDKGEAERMRITAGGNVGIGTQNPTDMLTVEGVIFSRKGGIRFPDGTIQITAYIPK
jgi:hypothetical protein